MKYEQASIDVESSGILKETSFGIQNVGFILDILRNKMYSDIKKSLVQEYCCNARDANREAGNETTPIKITLPSDLDPNWRVRDFGLGISPDRIENIFVLYGASTKRGDNQQTGGFGLGAKTGFGYGDGQFAINTFIDGIKRSYSAYIDESRCGVLALMSETPTTEPNGSEIIISVKKQDFSTFASHTHEVTKHWAVKPVIGNKIFDYEDYYSNPKYLFVKDNWLIGERRSSYENPIRIVLDGIEYNCIDRSNNNTIYELINWARYYRCVFLFFKTGELTVSANREQIENNEKNINVIANRIKTMIKGIETALEERVVNAVSYADANIAFDTIKSFTAEDGFGKHFSHLEFLTWNNKPLLGTNHRFQTVEFSYFKNTGSKGTKKDGKLDYNKSTEVVDSTGRPFHRNSARKIRPDGILNLAYLKQVTTPNSLIVIENDLEIQITANLLDKVFGWKPELNHAVIIGLGYYGRHMESFGALVKELGFINECISSRVKLSSIIGAINYKAPTAGPQAKELGKRFLIYKYDGCTNTFSLSSFESFNTDSTQKVLATLHKEKKQNKYQIKFGDKILVPSEDFQVLSFLRSMTDRIISLYAVSETVPEERLEEAFEDIEYTSLQDMLDRCWDEKKDGLAEAKAWLYANEYQFSTKIGNTHIQNPGTLKVQSKDDIFNLLFASHAEGLRRIDNGQKARNCFRMFGGFGYVLPETEEENPNVKVVKSCVEFHSSIQKAILSKYKLLAHLDSYHVSTEDIFEYVNLVHEASLLSPPKEETTAKEIIENEAA